MKPSKKGFILVSMLMVGFLTFVAATTTISDLKVESPFGKYLSIQTLIVDVPGTPLVFTDSANLTAYAVFNGPSNLSFSQIEGITDNLAFPTGTTSFLGDVSNFDDINGQSRFKETNINNGTSASAAFVAENDIGFTTAFGIGSSNFQFSGIPFNSNGAIFHNAPSPFQYANGDFFGWTWLANKGGFQTSINFTTSMNLTAEGNLIIDGNFTGNQFYGEMYIFAGFNPIVIEIDNILTINSSGIFGPTKITNWTEGEINGFTFFNDTLVTDVAGLYKIIYGVSYENSAQGRHAFVVTRNSIPIVKTASAGYVATANDIRTVNGVGLVRVDVGDVLAVKVGDRFNPPTDIEVLTASFDVIRIGD